MNLETYCTAILPNRTSLKKILVSISLLVLTQQLFGNNYQFQFINSDLGLSNNQVHSIYRDSYGFLWVGTMNGLNRYDGKNIKVYKNIPNDPYSLANNFVIKITEDQNGRLWLVARDGKLFWYNREKDNFSSDISFLSNNIDIPQNYITDFFVDDKNQYWLTNGFFGIFRYDAQSDSVVWLQNIHGDGASLVSNRIETLRQDNKGNYWSVNRQGILEQIDPVDYKVTDRINLIGEVNGVDEDFNLYVDNEDNLWIYSASGCLGLVRYNTKTKQKTLLSASAHADVKIKSSVVKGVTQDGEGNIWIGMDHGGIQIYNIHSGVLNNIFNRFGVPKSLPDNSVYHLYTDGSGIIWIGMYKGGVAYYHNDFFKFQNFYHNPFDNGSLCYNDVNCFTESKQGDIWVGTNGGGLARYKPQQHAFLCYTHNPDNPNSLSNNTVICACADSKDRLFFGTYFGGLNYFDGEKFQVFKHNPNDPSSISDDRVWQIFEDSQGGIWVGTLGGGVDIFDPETRRFISTVDENTPEDVNVHVYSIEEDANGHMWFGTAYGIDVYNQTTKTFEKFVGQQGNNCGLSNNIALVVKKDSRNWMWVGTNNGLNLYNPKTKTFRVFTEQHGLPNSTIRGIEIDSLGGLWLTTTKGLSNMIIDEVVDFNTFNYTFRNFTDNDGLLGNDFNERATFTTSSGEILIGGIKGFNRFYPGELKKEPGEHGVTLVGFELFNKEIKVDETINNRILLEKPIQSLDKLKLKYTENVFSIVFTSLDFLQQKKLMYQYKMQGFNNNWLADVSSASRATFTSLRPGKYVFKVRASVDGETWGPEKSIKIRIQAPWWRNTVAKLSYLFVFLSLIALLGYQIVRKERIKHIEENRKKEIERKEELDRLKIKFITNVSHEFKTPLTLILALSDKLSADGGLAKYHRQVEMIGRNGKRLLNLVNQLLDFRKLEVSQLRLNLSCGDIVVFLRDSVASFADLSESKNIDLSFTTKVDRYMAWFDQDKIEKIIFNLISNAFKFTPEKGEVTVKFQLEEETAHKNFKGVKDWAQIMVVDTGIGISGSNKEQVFERFFQEGETGAISNQGTGIGLSLVKEFVKLHQGNIRVSSEKGIGTSFIISLPLALEQFTLVDQEQAPLGDAEVVEQPGNNIEEVPEPSPERAHVLIVEDNEDLRFYLKDNLQSSYIVSEAENGKVAWESVMQAPPDLIVSDVMMPEMDGVEFCTKIKNDPRTSHLPVILLTAKSSDLHKKEGLEAGANDYITKPFSYEVLELKIRNLIKSREKFRQRFIASLGKKTERLEENSLDEKFFKQAVEVVEENIESESFSVDQLGRELSISRAHLYKKLMALTGKSPAGFIRTIRMKKAAQLIQQGGNTISEVAYMVGYNGPRYFTKHFKEEFAVTPSQYSKQKQGNSN